MKLKGRQIIIFGLPRFDAEIESTSYTTAKLLAHNNFVYYVENPFTLKDYFSKRKKQEYNVRKPHFSLASTSLIDTEIPTLKVVISPILLSINFLPEGPMFRIFLKFSEIMIRSKIKKIIDTYGIKDFVFINSFNFHYPGISKGLAPALTVYHCLDPMIMPFDMKHGIKSENMLVKSSDIVICSSRQLYLEKKKLNPATYFVANAADLKHSQKALLKNLKVFPSVSILKKPVIGYFGAIERRIDYNLLIEVIGQNPDKSFVFVGPVSSGYVHQDFLEHANVHFPGPVSYQDMPAVIKGFDVAIIPFKKDEVSPSIFPLKLFEYLGAGKPVVSINFNDNLKDFTKETVAYCADAQSFTDAINQALKSDNDEQRQRRLEIASENTWEIRITEIADIIYEHLN